MPRAPVTATGTFARSTNATTMRGWLSDWRLALPEPISVLATPWDHDNQGQDDEHQGHDKGESKQYRDQPMATQ